MTWLPFALASIAGFGLWGLLGKLALDHATWAQVSLLFGAVTLAGFAITLGFQNDAWSSRGIWLGGLTGVAGTVGLACFYLALERGQASQVVPVIGVYPALTAVLAVLFLSDALSATQVAGVCLAVTGVLLVGLGG